MKFDHTKQRKPQAEGCWEDPPNSKGYSVQEPGKRDNFRFAQYPYPNRPRSPEYHDEPLLESVSTTVAHSYE